MNGAPEKAHPEEEPGVEEAEEEDVDMDRDDDGDEEEKKGRVVAKEPPLPPLTLKVLHERARAAHAEARDNPAHFPSDVNINDALPVELLDIVFQFVGEVSPETFMEAVPHVCRLWREIAYRSPVWKQPEMTFVFRGQRDGEKTYRRLRFIADNIFWPRIQLKVPQAWANPDFDRFFLPLWSMMTVGQILAALFDASDSHRLVPLVQARASRRSAGSASSEDELTWPPPLEVDRRGIIFQDGQEQILRQLRRLCKNKQTMNDIEHVALADIVSRSYYIGVVKPPGCVLTPGRITQFNIDVRIKNGALVRLCDELSDLDPTTFLHEQILSSLYYQPDEMWSALRRAFTLDLTFEFCESLLAPDVFAGFERLSELDLSTTADALPAAIIKSLGALPELETLRLSRPERDLDLSPLTRLTSLSISHAENAAFSFSGQQPQWRRSTPEARWGRQFTAGEAPIASLDLSPHVYVTHLPGLRGFDALAKAGRLRTLHLDTVDLVGGLSALEGLERSLKHLHISGTYLGCSVDKLRFKARTSNDPRKASLEFLAHSDSTLTSLIFQNCWGLASLEGLSEIHSVTLRDLSVHDAINIARLGEGHINTLVLTGLAAARADNPFTSAAGLETIPHLDLSGCTSLSDVSTLGGGVVQSLRLRGCTNLTSVEGLQTIQELDVSHCSMLHSAVCLGGADSDVRVLHLKGEAYIPPQIRAGPPCPVYPAPWVAGVHNIRELDFTNTGLQDLNFLLDGCVEIFRAQWCTKLTNVYGARRVRVVDLSYCSSIRNAWSLGATGSYVEALKLHQCTGLTSVRELQNISELDLSFCAKLRDVSTLASGCVERLNITGCKGIDNAGRILIAISHVRAKGVPLLDPEFALTNEQERDMNADDEPPARRAKIEPMFRPGTHESVFTVSPGLSKSVLHARRALEDR